MNKIGSDKLRKRFRSCMRREICQRWRTRLLIARSC